MPIYNDFTPPETNTLPGRLRLDGQTYPESWISTRDESREIDHSYMSVYNPFFTGRPRTPTNSSKTEPLDRQRLIRRLKGVEAQTPNEVQPRHRTTAPSVTTSRKRKSPSPPVLLPSPDIARFDRSEGEASEGWEMSGLQIDRPRSALHKGDFRNTHESQWTNSGVDSCGSLKGAEQSTFATSPVAPWHKTFPIAASGRHLPDVSSFQTSIWDSVESLPRTRAFSQVSVSGSFTYQPPTSPLVQQANAADIPDHDILDQHLARSPSRIRRHTYSPRSLQNHRIPMSRMPITESNSQDPWPSPRRESSYPYQAHQPRRSISSITSLSRSPITGPRRPSNSEGSSLQHAMVGSYEESILRGRMSTTPSKPLDFVAQIGVLGKGECKSSLRCPPHLTVPFPAVYYSYPNNYGSSVVDPQPSPYVGLVDLESQRDANCLESTFKPARSQNFSLVNQQSRSNSPNKAEDGPLDVRVRRRRRQKQSRRSRSPLETPEGGYRIPGQGQIQIVIKNPNKTAVKLFLVPYDVSDMQPGQKTFIRQRSYSAGPIIDMPLCSRNNLGSDRPEAALSTSTNPQDRPVLRYLVHLHICCTSKGRYYLYKSIRVVFANRVPDGKEKLRNEIQMPEPRYSIYKPGRDSIAGLTVDPCVLTGRRKSAIGIAAPSPRSPLCRPHGVEEHSSDRLQDNVFPYAHSYDTTPVRESRTSSSFHFPRLPTVDSRPASRDRDSGTELGTRIGEAVRMSPTLSQSTAPSTMTGTMTFSRDCSQESLAGGKAESLLSKRLKDLGMRGWASNEEGR